MGRNENKVKGKSKGTTLRSARHAESGKAPKPSVKTHALQGLSTKERRDRKPKKEEPVQTKAKWKSPAQRLEEMQVDLGRVKKQRSILEGKEEDEGEDPTFSLFGAAVGTLNLVNLSRPFVEFYRIVEPKSRSLPLVIHHQQEIVGAICTALQAPHEDLELSGEHILDLIPSLITDLDTLLLPNLPTLLTALINLTTPSQLFHSTSKILQHLYDVLGIIFRDLGKAILSTQDTGNFEQIWTIVRLGLGAPLPPVVEAEEKELKDVEMKEESAASDDESDNEEDVEEKEAQPELQATHKTPTLRKLRTTPQTRRLLASSFAFLIRKAKSGPGTSCDLERIYQYIFADLQELVHNDGGASQQKHHERTGKTKNRTQSDGYSILLAEGIIWTVVESCSGPNDVLHSRTASIIRTILNATVSTPDELFESISVDVVEHSLIGLSNHVRNVEGYQTVVEEVLAFIKSSLSKERDWFLTRKAMRALQTIMTIYRGKRISASQLPQAISAFSLFSPIISSADLPSAHILEEYILMATAVLRQTTFQDVIAGTTKRALDTVFSSPTNHSLHSLACATAASLLKPEWKLLETAVLPSFLALTGVGLPLSERPEGFDTLSISTMSCELVAQFAESGFLKKSTGAVFNKWKVSLGDFCVKRVNEWITSFDGTRCEQVSSNELLNIFIIAPFTPQAHEKLSQLLIQLVTRLSKTPKENALEDYYQWPTNIALILGKAFQLLIRISPEVELNDVALDILTSFSWHRPVMAGIASVISSLKIDGNHKEHVYNLIIPNILSEDSLLRLASLEILASLFPEGQTPIAFTLIQHCIEVERVPLTVQTAREKSMKVRKLGIVANSQMGTTDEDCTLVFDLVIRYLLAMLKVNFKPLWEEVIQDLALLAKKYPDQVWMHAVRELTAAATRSSTLFITTKPQWCETSLQISMKKRWEEKQLNDFNVNIHQQAVTRQMHLFGQESSFLEERQRESISAQFTKDRLVIPSYEAQILALLCELPDLAQKHNRDFTPTFFTCFKRSMLDDSEAPALLHAESNKERKSRLIAWLTLYSKLYNPKALFRGDELLDQFLQLLAFPDVEVQKVALECVLKRKSPALVENADRLRYLLDSTKLRDELLKFVSVEQGESVQADHRQEIVPLIIREGFGIMISRLGRSSASSGHGRIGRRAAILGALKTCSQSELDTLVNLTIGPIPPTKFDSGILVVPKISTKLSGKRQLGYLGFLADLLKHLGKEIVLRWPDLLGATITLLHAAQQNIEHEGEDHEESDVESEDGEDESEVNSSRVPYRKVRQLCIKRLVDFFKLGVTFDFSNFLAAIFPSIINPRVTNLAAENAQSPSGLLDLFLVWAQFPQFAPFLVKYNEALLPALYEILTVRNVKPVVILRVFDIITGLLSHSEKDQGKGIIQPGLDSLLGRLSKMFQNSSASFDPRNEVNRKQIVLLSQLAPYVTSPTQAADFLTFSVPLLQKPHKIVPETTKFDILAIFSTLYPLAAPSPDSELHRKSFQIISTLFSTVRSRNARLQLVAAFSAISLVIKDLVRVAGLIEELNSFSTKRSEEPDFDRRLDAFTKINEHEYSSLTMLEWEPLLSNMMFFVQDPEELSIRSNAAFTFRRFVSTTPSPESTNAPLLTSLLLPALRKGLNSKVELARGEVLTVYGYMVETTNNFPELDELKCLLFGDDEANFFQNISHIQVHRRTRALRRFTDLVEAKKLSNKSVVDLFFPIINPIIFNEKESRENDLINEAVQCLARVSKHLSWSPYNKMLRQYLSQAKKDGVLQKPCIRALIATTSAFHFDLSEDERLLGIVTSKLLPDLMNFVEKRDETNEEMRITVTEGINIILQHLPPAQREVPETGMLMTLSQVLRTTNQHLRDATRSTICNIAVASPNPTTLLLLAKELRRALTRGPQLHVLAFTIHALLVRLYENIEARPSFDCVVAEVVPVLSDDIFGVPGKERASEDFRSKTKIREVRYAKSFDSFELLSKNISGENISILLAPLRGVLQVKNSSRVLKDVEECLRRITNGLTMNPSLTPVDILDLCYSLAGQTAAFLKPAIKTAKKLDKVAPDYKVQLTQVVQDEQNLYASNSHKFVSFGLDLFHVAFKKGKFDLSSTQILSKLSSLVNLVGNALYSEEPTLLARAIRVTSDLFHCPLESIEKATPVFIRQILAIVDNLGITSSELAQYSLRTLAVIIRDGKTAKLSEQQLVKLLVLIGPDLEETEQQSTLFQLLRAIMSKKFVAPEIYDLMEKVAEMLVTNQSGNVRELCRAIYLQFLLDYPQGKGRLQKSLSFIARNVSYVHESGRLSVLDLMNAIINKFGASLLKESADLFFVSLFMAVANDESSKCREIAAELIKSLLEKLEEAEVQNMVEMLLKWAAQGQTQSQLTRTAIQVLGIAIDSIGSNGAQTAAKILEISVNALEESRDALVEAEESGHADIELESDWQLAYHSLQCLGRIQQTFPAELSPEIRINQHAWALIRGHFLYPHVWVRTAAARLMKSLFDISEQAGSKSDLDEDHPLSTVSLLDAAQKSALQLKSAVLTEELAGLASSNLYYAAICFAARQPSGSKEVQNEEDEENEYEEDAEDEKEASPLRWLFTRLSYQLRSAHIARPSMHATTSAPWSLQPIAILRWFSAMIKHFDKGALTPYLVAIITPIFRIAQDPNAQDPQMVELQSVAQQVREELQHQDKIGTTEFANLYNQIQQKAATRRNERRTAIALQAMNDPAQEAKRKAKRNEQKTRQKKRKASAFAEKKLRYGLGSKRIRRE